MATKKKQDVTELAMKLEAEATMEPVDVESVDDFEEAMMKLFQEGVNTDVYKGAPTAYNPEAEMEMKRLGCQNPACRNYKNKLIVDAQTAASDHHYVDVTYPTKMRGIPVAHCAYCKREYNAVVMKVIDPKDAMETIKNLQEKINAG